MSEGYRFRILGSLPGIEEGGVGEAARLSATQPTCVVHLAPVANGHALDPDDLQRLESLLPQLRHRAMLSLEDIVDIGGHAVALHAPFEGTPLSRLRRLGPLPVGPALELIEEIADALSAAESMLDPTTGTIGLAHGALHLDTVILSPRGEVKVAGFGLCLLQDTPPEGPTRAPERSTDGPSHAADVYAIGAAIASLVLGEDLPLAQRKASIHNPQIHAALDRSLSMSRPVRQLFVSMLEHDPGKRPMARELQRAAWQLRGTTFDPRLRDWAGARIGPLLPDPTVLSGGPALTSRSLLRPSPSAAGVVPDPSGTPVPVQRAAHQQRRAPPPSSTRPSPPITDPPSRWVPPALPVGTREPSVAPGTSASEAASPSPPPRPSSSSLSYDEANVPPTKEEVVIRVAPDEIGPPHPEPEPEEQSADLKADPFTTRPPEPAKALAEPEPAPPAEPPTPSTVERPAPAKPEAQPPSSERHWNLIMMGSIALAGVLIMTLICTVPLLFLPTSEVPAESPQAPAEPRIQKIHPSWAGTSWPIKEADIRHSDARVLMLDYEGYTPDAVLELWTTTLTRDGWAQHDLPPSTAASSALLRRQGQKLVLKVKPYPRGTHLHVSRER
ncbi:MAG: hypothetical protein EA397_11325 [Deltaproteobacteria bacterium]|nr:MAG: hypothetical protein EA397_11325 [Deltaproteobacteria bacterium]